MQILFDIHNSRNISGIYDNNGGIFGKYDINKTPSVIHIHNSKVDYISFDDFMKNNYNYRSVLEKYIKEK